VGASAPDRLAQLGQPLTLITADAHPADPQLLSGSPAAQALQVPQPQHRRLASGELIEELLQLRRLRPGGGFWIGPGGGQLIQQAAFPAGQGGIKRRQVPAELCSALLLQPPWHADQPAQITGVMEQSAADAARDIGRRRDRILDPAARQPQRHARHLAAIIKLQHPAATPVEAGGDGISKRAELVETGLDGGLAAVHGLGGVGRANPGHDRGVATLSKDQALWPLHPPPPQDTATRRQRPGSPQGRC
jgi:hypothetical protein